MHAISASTNDSTISTTYVNTNTVLTFTSTKSNILVSFTMSGYTDPSLGPDIQSVSARIVMDAATTNTSIGGTSTSGLSADAIGDLDGDFNLCFSKLVTGVTPGVHTFTLQWLVTPVATPTMIHSPAGSFSNFYHRTISAMEF
jgi:hypothetical protein